MIERFPFGKAPFWLGLVALASVIMVLSVRERKTEERADLTYVSFVPTHLASYRKVIGEFERQHGVKVSLQLLHQRALQTRLQNAMLAGTEVPDMVELLEGSIGFFTRGPLKDVGFVDLTERIDREGYRSRLVESRLSLWSTRDRVFALPHDVHPVMLMYRADLVEKLGIDVAALTTWDEFARVGRSVVTDLDGDGINDRYMIDLPASGSWGLTVLLLQRDINLFDARGQVAFNTEGTIDTIVWYLRQTYGPGRIAYECGWGQSLMKAMTDGLSLFYIAPDWRTGTTEQEVPHLRGKMKLMPLPAWEEGGRRTSVWGGTGLAITKKSPNPDLDWQLAKFLYFNQHELGQRFLSTNILPPFKDAWDLPEFQRGNAYFSGQKLGALFASLAKETPPVWSTPYSPVAAGKLSEAFLRAAEHYKRHGEDGLRSMLQEELSAAEAYVTRIVERNVLAQD